MFTRVVDEAINRVTHNGYEVAVAYDPCPFNPLEDMDIQGFAIRSHERNTIDHDPDGTMRDYQGLVSDKEEALDYIGWIFDYQRQAHGDNWWEHVDENNPSYAARAQDVIDGIEAIDDYDSQLESYEVYEYVAVDEYGHPRYTVVVDMPLFKLAWGPSCSEHKDIALSIAKDYAAWANGSVYLIGAARGDEEAEYIGNVIGIDPYDNEVLIEYAENYCIL
mgnify:CR=1 FL=1